MDKKNPEKELKKRVKELAELIATEVVKQLNEENQKSKKTGKMYCRDPCTFKALYATHQYGCSGFPDEDECLICEMRR